MRTRFKTGDRVSLREPQSTGSRKRTPVYSYGVVIDTPADLPQLPTHGGFRYVLMDGTDYRRIAYTGRLTLLARGGERGGK